MQPWPSNKGTATDRVMSFQSLTNFISLHILTAVETAADTHNDNLDSQESTQTCQNSAALLVDGVNSDDMNDWKEAE